jgi:hypothetical protein
MTQLKTQRTKIRYQTGRGSRQVWEDVLIKLDTVTS